jgi:hypothetical protein
MTTLITPQRERSIRNSTASQDAPPSTWLHWLIWPALALAAALLLFCHGCHGDEDNELFVSAQQKSPRSEAVGWHTGRVDHDLGTRIGSN